LSGFARTRALESIFNIGAFGVMNVGVSKQVMKNKGSIRLNVRDILWSQKISGYTKYDNVDANFRQVQDSRVVNLSFTYRFSKGKVSTQQRQRSGAEDEKSRVGGANN
ncbi:outer membrane beta-barrel protein, partial [Klebsiella pneumoniae]|uniref:outer membrane beta-barrel protein n=1 Tax=Klebsiella pneumoniae TaxID=573 RepID=UPI003854C02D